MHAYFEWFHDLIIFSPGTLMYLVQSFEIQGQARLRYRVPDPSGIPLARSRPAGRNACKINKSNQFRFASRDLPTWNQTQPFSNLIFYNVYVYYKMYIHTHSRRKLNLNEPFIFITFHYLKTFSYWSCL